MNQNTLEKTFRNGSDGKRRFTPINKTSERFSTLCKELIQDEGDFQSTHLHIWFGLPKNWEIPIRLPALLVPALEIIKRLLEWGIEPPQLIIYQATSIISEVNKIPREDAINIATIMETRLHNFIKENFPRLLPYINIEFWEKENDWDTLEIIKGYSWKISKTLWENGSNSHFQECERRYSNWNNAYTLYVTANTFYNGGFDEYPFQNTNEPQNIIPIWGRSEAKFFETLLQTQTSLREIFPLITQIGAFPTYYHNPRWDIGTSEELSDYLLWGNRLHPDIEKDLKILSSYTL